jgi:hypothetical protein
MANELSACPLNSDAARAKGKTSPAFIHSKLDDFGLRPNQFRVYCHIVRRAGAIGGTFYESVPNCAAHCKIHVKTARSVISCLLSLNLIELVGCRNGCTKTYRVTSIEEWKPLPNGYRSIKLGSVSKRESSPTNPIPGTHTNLIPTKVIPKGFPNKAGGFSPGLEKRDGGLIAKDRERIQKQIREEREKENPDKDIIAGLRSELAGIDDELRRRGKAAPKTNPASRPQSAGPAKPTPAPEQPKPVKIWDLPPTQREDMQKQLREAIKP